MIPAPRNTAPYRAIAPALCVLSALSQLSVSGCQLGRNAEPTLRSSRAARFAPWDERALQRSPTVVEVDAPRGATDGLVAVYQRSLRAETLPEGGCPFSPTCSVYARHAIEAYGPLLGLVMAFDRLLIREHIHSHHHYPHVRDGSRTVLLDPVP